MTFVPCLLQASGSLHAALVLTARFLSAHGQGLGQAGQPTIHTHKTLQMWSARISLLIQLRLYKEAELELQAFGEMLNPDLYYQYHTNSYPGMKGKVAKVTVFQVCCWHKRWESTYHASWFHLV